MYQLMLLALLQKLHCYEKRYQLGVVYEISLNTMPLNSHYGKTMTLFIPVIDIKE